MPPNILAATTVAEITAQQGLYQILRFQDLGGILTPPSDDLTDWWEPKNLTHRAELYGIQASGADTIEAITQWGKIASARKFAGP
jgi:hypothetical protein